MAFDPTLPANNSLISSSELPNRRLSVFSFVLGGLYLAVLCAIGYASPQVSELYQSFEWEDSWQLHILRSIHQITAAAIGLAACILILWKDRAMKKSLSRKINIVALVTLVLIAVLWPYIV